MPVSFQFPIKYFRWLIKILFLDKRKLRSTDVGKFGRATTSSACRVSRSHHECSAFPTTNSIHPNGATFDEQLRSSYGECHFRPGRESDQ